MSHKGQYKGKRLHSPQGREFTASSVTCLFTSHGTSNSPAAGDVHPYITFTEQLCLLTPWLQVHSESARDRHFPSKRQGREKAKVPQLASAGTGPQACLAREPSSFTPSQIKSPLPLLNPFLVPCHIPNGAGCPKIPGLGGGKDKLSQARG
jgi:hypothetical protein